MSAQTLREAALVLLQQADIMEGKPSSTFMGQHLPAIMAMWETMKAQYAAEDLTRVPVATCYETHKYLWKAAEREGWPAYPGSPTRFWSGNYQTAQAFTAAIVALMKTDEAKAWLAHPANAHQVPKVDPTV